MPLRSDLPIDANAMQSFLRDFFNAFFNVIERVFAPTSALEIVRQDENLLVLKNNSRQFAINKRFRTVKSGTQVLAQFDAIETIDITHRRASDDSPEHWSVSLNLKGWFASITIGDARNDLDASIVAAKISTFTGKKVRSL